MGKHETAKKPVRLKRAAVLLLAVLLTAALAAAVSGCAKTDGPAAELLPAGWPSSLQGEVYVEPPFEDVPGRTNNAFNVADFGEQGSNGWY